MTDKRDIILNSIADGVFTVDMNFRVTYINRAAEKILGISSSEAVGKFCGDIFHADICEHSCALEETFRTGKNIISRNIYIVDSEGDKKPVSISTALLKDEKGNIVGGVESFRDVSDLEELRKKIEESYVFEDIISKNRKITDLFNILPDIAESDSSVLIEGESGTGKELVARALHNLSSRRESSLVTVNCGALPENLIESELFGYMAGAFTDAKKNKTGKIAAAESGTLFLDEVGELPLSVQVKLLRFLQERVYEPLGSVNPVASDVRIIAATNRNLYNEVKASRFREDLFYRLNIFRIELPPLRERMEDIPVLVKHFIKIFNALKGKSIEGVSDETMNILLGYGFPGNIRELENIIEHAFVLCKNPNIQPEHLPPFLGAGNEFTEKIMTLAEVERVFIERMLIKNSGNRKKTAEELGIDSSTLWRKLKKYQIDE